MDGIIIPHGGCLRESLIEDPVLLKESLKEAQTLLKVPLATKEISDAVMLGIGAFSPLRGFMDRDDYLGVINEMRLADGTMWPIPITLSISAELGEKIKEGRKIALFDPECQNIIGCMEVRSIFRYDRKKEAKNVFRTDEETHPGVKKIYGQGEIYLGGPVEIFNQGGYPENYPEYARPAETRAIFSEKGWKTVAAFQTRNPIHRSHEYLTKVALEICDGLFIHPVVGKLKPGDIPAEVRMKCYKAIIDNYYPKERVVLKACPIEMRYGGPREALLHAIIRQNFGCSHIIIGRDHAGVGKYYGPYDAQEMFDSLRRDDLVIKPIKMDWTFWCTKCGSIASARTCPHTNDYHLMISGTDLRALLAEGKRPPDEFGRPEVIDILVDYYSTL